MALVAPLQAHQQLQVGRGRYRESLHRGCMYGISAVQIEPVAVDFNLSTDNLTDRHYFETQNFFVGR